MLVVFKVLGVLNHIRLTTDLTNKLAEAGIVDATSWANFKNQLSTGADTLDIDGSSHVDDGDENSYSFVIDHMTGEIMTQWNVDHSIGSEVKVDTPGVENDPNLSLGATVVADGWHSEGDDSNPDGTESPPQNTPYDVRLDFSVSLV